MEFTIGDTIIVKDNYMFPKSFRGKIGTVKDVVVNDSDIGRIMYLVAFCEDSINSIPKDDLRHLHTGMGRCKIPICYWFSERYITKAICNKRFKLKA